MMKYIRIFSLVSFSLIMLVGSMSPVPFIFWLGFTFFDFGNIDQLFAFLGISGIVLNLMKFKYDILISFLSIVLMLTAVASRLMYVAPEALNYPAFTIPFYTFISTQVINILKTKN